jgi:PAS domain S-box-containing protein
MTCVRGSVESMDVSLPFATELEQAIDRHEFQLYYQPKLDLVSGKISGVEALIRWEHPEKGLLLPAEFIPIAEETGLIVPIGEWVILTACEQNKAWQRQGDIPQIIVAVNLSARQLYQPNFVENVQHVLEETALSPEYLELEITESILMDVPRVLPVVKALKRLGVRISLDDFGTGYSSLFYLKEFPVDKIKIDQSFIRNCTTDSKDATIVKAFIAMAHQLELEVIAEGIESKDHLVFLQQNFSNKGQGHFFSKPLLPDEFIQQFHEIEQIIDREGIPQEISRQNWLEKELESTRQELRDTVRQQQGMIFKYKEQSGKFILTLCDGELLYRVGLTPEMVIGKELHDFLTKEDTEGILQYFRRAWDGEDNITYESEINGIWYLASLRPIRKGGQVSEVIGSCVDITERVKKEREAMLLAQRLSEQEAKYRLIADNSNDFIILLDANKIVRYISPSHERLLGISTDGSVNQPGFRKVHPEDVLHMKQLFDGLIANKNVVSTECRYLRSDGSYIWVEAMGNPIISLDGEVEYVLVVARDISERKVQEEKLRQSEQCYRRLIELSPEAILVYVEGKIVYVNNATVKMMLADSREDLIGRSVFDFICPSARKGLTGGMESMMKSEKDTIELIEQSRLCINGKEIIVEITGGKINYDGKPAVQLFIRDVTLRKEAERLIAEEKGKLESLLNNAQDAINIMDLNGDILRTNPAWEALYGWTQDEVLRKPNPIVPAEQFNTSLLTLIDRITQHEMIPPHEMMAYCKDGKQLHVSESLYPIHDGNGRVIAVAGSTRDITSRKEAERKLQESEAKYRVIAENMQDLIGIVDTNGFVRYASPSHEAVLGFSPQLYEGCSAFKLVHPDDVPYVEKQFTQMVTCKVPCQVEFRYKHVQGNWVYVEALGTPVLDKLGEVKHIVVVARDISERKKTEEVILKSEKLSIAGQMAAGIAHEIRNPLTSIKGFIQLLKEEAEDTSYFDMILVEINRLEDIVSGFLAIAKPQVLQMKEVNVKSILEQVVLLFSTQAILKNIEIIKEQDFNLLPIYCNADQIEQVLINLLQNALEATDKGGIIKIQALWHGLDHIKFRVIDHGCGISKERQKHLGEPFFSTKEKGTGLGLMISQKIVQEHGGSIHIESILSQGTTVDVILPIKHSNLAHH